MHDLSAFRTELRVRRRAVGRTQQQLARAVGLHPDVLSHKLNRTDGADLTVADAVGLIAVLAGWGMVASRAEAGQLLLLAGAAPQAIAALAWASPGLAALPAGEEVSAPSAPALRLRLAPGSPPAQATALIGRERELARVAAALTSSRLVTLTGTGGAGKTRLAVQTAADQASRSSDGVAFVGLAQVGDPELLAVSIVAALGLRSSVAAAEDDLTSALADRSLLVLDNLEHLLEGVPLLSRLLSAAPDLRILATSRTALRLSGEHIVRVPPLSLPGDNPAAPPQDSEAVRLFTARAEAVRPGFADQPGDVAAIAAICTCLDGLPLAIELAAARVRLWPPKVLLPMLRSRLTLLTGGPRDRPARQQTLRATLDWSYKLLPEPGQELFRRLGVFAGPFDAAAAAAVTAACDAEAILARLTDLADQSLLEIMPGATPLFRLLQTVSEYASARLAEAGEQADARRRHLAYYLRLAEEVRNRFPAGPKTPELLDILQTALPDIEAALDFASHQAGEDGVSLDEGLRLATAAGPLWRSGSRFDEGSLQLSRLLAVGGPRECDPATPAGARALLEAGDLARVSGHLEQAAERPGSVG